jgi:hypothetical protein
MSHNDPTTTPQQPTTTPQRPTTTQQRPTMTHYDPQRPTTTPQRPHYDPLRPHYDPTTTHYDPTTTHNDPQRPTRPHNDQKTSHSDPQVHNNTTTISACASGSFAFPANFDHMCWLLNMSDEKGVYGVVQLQIVINIFRPNILAVKIRSLISFALCEKFCSHYEHRLSSCCSAVCASFI